MGFHAQLGQQVNVKAYCQCLKKNPPELLNMLKQPTFMGNKDEGPRLLFIS
jgi:hypothetical protein